MRSARSNLRSSHGHISPLLQPCAGRPAPCRPAHRGSKCAHPPAAWPPPSSPRPARWRRRRARPPPARPCAPPPARTPPGAHWVMEGWGAQRVAACECRAGGGSRTAASAAGPQEQPLEAIHCDSAAMDRGAVAPGGSQAAGAGRPCLEEVAVWREDGDGAVVARHGGLPLPTLLPAGRRGCAKTSRSARDCSLPSRGLIDGCRMAGCAQGRADRVHGAPPACMERGAR